MGLPGGGADLNRPFPSRTGFQNWRLYVVYGIILFVFGFFTFRLFSLQVINGADYLTRAEDNRTMTINVPTQRGIIYDRNGFVLARNTASYNITITPAALPSDAGAVQEVYRQLSAMIGVPVSQGLTDEATVKVFKPCDNDLGLTQIVYIADTNAPYNAVEVKCNVDQALAMTVRERAADLPGVDVEIVPVRDYPTGNLTSEIIGFLGPITAEEEKTYTDLGFVSNRDKIGFAGVEKSLNTLLMGTNGKRVVEQDVAGQVLQDLKPPLDPVPGNNIKLTIDTRLQAAARSALIGQMDALNKRFPNMGLNTGAVVAMNPKTGEILAMVSVPNYENNRMAKQIPSYYLNQLNSDPTNPLLNHAISGEYPPGSVYKLTTSLGILNEHNVDPNLFINDPGRITLTEKFSPNNPGQTRDFVCYTYKTTGAGHGKVDFLKGISQSCDVYFYKVAGGYPGEVDDPLGIDRMKQYALALGYGAPTGIELPGEISGVEPDPTWKRLNQGENWSNGDTYIAAIGQGYVTATPMQVLLSMATVANDGKQMQPTLVREILDAEGNVVVPFTPKLKVDLTVTPTIAVYDADGNDTGTKKAVEPAAIQLLKEGLRKVIVDGTGSGVFAGFSIPSAGKTGTAEYCDNIAQSKNLCSFGNWPAHAWYAGYAPYDDPEIAVVAFVYNGNEGSTTCGPIVRQVMQAYFDLKASDAANQK
jgi:penicillin-binding protein 2